MRMPSGVTDQYIYFVAVDATDKITPETGLSSFTVYRSRNGGAATAYTTPTITEVSASNMPGWYKFLLDEDMTIDAGDDSQEMAFHITASGMAPVYRTIELYRRTYTAGATCPTLTGDAYARLGVPAGASVSADVAAVKGVLPAALVSGRIDASVGAMASGVLTATAIAADAITDAKVASDVTIASVTGNVGGVASGGITSASFASGAITATAIAADAIGASELAADAVAEIQSGLATASNLAAVKTIADKLDSAMELDSTVYRFTTNALEQAPSGGGGGLDAAGVRAAIGLASANLDAQLDALPTAAENAAALLAATTESTLTVVQAMRLWTASAAGKASGMGTTTVTIRDYADTKARITATVTADGDRTVVTRDVT